MKVGDLVKFTKTDFLGTILHIDRFNCEIFVHGAPHFRNPTWMSKKMLKRNAEVVDENR